MTMLKATCANTGVGRLCMLFGRTRHAFYDRLWFLKQRDDEHILVLEMVAEIRREIPRIGTGKLYQMLRKPLQTNDIKMGRDRLHALLQDHGLTAALRAIGRLEAQYEKTEPQTKTVVGKSKAPAPINPIRSAANGRDVNLTSDGQFHGSYQAWRAARLAGKIR